jgi:2-C-methyl-D-erythritol 2,4-cyclodiphosphate synthase
MIVLASFWAKLHPPYSGTFVSELIAYGPFILVILLFAFVWWYDGKLKQRARLEKTQSEAKRPGVRCGIGYDLHRLAEGRKLIVGGIEVPFEKGPVGHSDGDVVAHALCDALFGAAGLGDIGTHFPDSDPKWKGANSLLFLEHARKLLDEKHFAIEYVDAVVILERPKLGPHFPKMREALAKSLRVPVEKIHLKAKTNEGVDAVGRGEAIAAYVIATLSAS